MIEPIWMCCACAEAHDPKGSYELVWRDGRRKLEPCAHCGQRTQRRRRIEDSGDGGQR